MDISSGRCLFQKRNERIDWRKLAAVDVEKIAREIDVDAIQENILNVTYCNVEQELGYNGLDANVIKLFRLAQLTIEYLLHSQEFLQQCLTEKDKKVESFNDQLGVQLTECSSVKEELAKRNESYKALKKELQKAKKLIGDYQLMVRAGAQGLHRCSSCTKSFVSEYYLRSHVERRHPDAKQPMTPQQLPQQQQQQQQLMQKSMLHDETFFNDLNEIKSRLKATEEELKREHQTVCQLNQQESKRSQEMLEILKKHEQWKNEEQDEMKAQMEKYKSMMVLELKETQREKEQLQHTVDALQQSTDQWRRSALGNLEDDNDVSKIQYDELNAQITELSQKLSQTRRENDDLKKTSEKWRVASKGVVNDERKINELEDKVQKVETHFKREIERLRNKYQSDLEQTRESCNEHLRKVQEENRIARSTAVVDIADGVVNFEDEEPAAVQATAVTNLDTPVADADGSVVFWVALNLSISNCYRVSVKASSSVGEWKDMYSFHAFLAPVELFHKAVHVYTCAGSPFWRQYISLADKPPSPNYKKELTFYVSEHKLMGTAKLYILDIGSSMVTRSMISKKESVDGWKEKNAHFFVLKAGMLRDSVNKSLTGNNSEIFRSVSDDEVSLSSLTGTDVVRGTLADALKESRENLLVDDTNDESKVEAYVNTVEESEEESESEALEESIRAVEAVVQQEMDNDKFGGTESSSFLGTTLPEKGEFFPFPNNTLAVARYNHTREMVAAQREEMIRILEDNLIKRGIDIDEERMLSSIYKSKMKNHEKEVTLIDKQYPGCNDTRKRLAKAIQEHTEDNFTSKKKKINTSVKSAETVVKAAVRFHDEVTPIRKASTASSPSRDASESPTSPSDLVHTAIHTTSTPKEKQSKSALDNAMSLTVPPASNKRSIPDTTAIKKDLHLSDSESESWDSDELEDRILQAHTPKQKIDTAINNHALLNDFDSSVSTPRASWEKPAAAAATAATPATKYNNDHEDFQVSDSSEWDSDELSVKHLHSSPDDPVRILHGSMDGQQQQQQAYNPRLLPPRGEKVKELSASLELALGSRDSSKRKPAGGVDISNM